MIYLIQFADMLREDSEFLGNRYPKEVCERILRGMDTISSLRPDKLIECMNPSEFSVMCCIIQHSRRNGVPPSVADIAAPLGVSVPAVSRTLRYLQEKGWIIREIDAADRRSIRVTATAPGEEIVRRNIKTVVCVLNRILSVFSQEEMRTISELYSKFANAMANELNREENKC